MENKKIARILDIAALEAEAVKQISLEHQINLSDAYEIQRLNIDRRIARGEKMNGIKMGFTSYAKMEQMGINDLIWGRLTDEMFVANGESIRLDKFIHPRAEPELCFLVSQDIDRPIKLEEINDYIEAVAPAIEIIDSRYKDFKFSLEDVIADNCSSSAFVFGNWLGLEKYDLNDLKVTLLFDGENIQDGSTRDILGNPLLSIVEASRITHKYGFTIEKGSYLMAGAATPASYLKNNLHVQAHIEQLGSVELNVI